MKKVLIIKLEINLPSCDDIDEMKEKIINEPIGGTIDRKILEIYESNDIKNKNENTIEISNNKDIELLSQRREIENNLNFDFIQLIEYKLILLADWVDNELLKTHSLQMINSMIEKINKYLLVNNSLLLNDKETMYNKLIDENIINKLMNNLIKQGKCRFYKNTKEIIELLHLDITDNKFIIPTTINNNKNNKEEEIVNNINIKKDIKINKKEKLTELKQLFSTFEKNQESNGILDNFRSVKNVTKPKFNALVKLNENDLQKEKKVIKQSILFKYKEILKYSQICIADWCEDEDIDIRAIKIVSGLMKETEELRNKYNFIISTLNEKDEFIMYNKYSTLGRNILMQIELQISEKYQFNNIINISNELSKQMNKNITLEEIAFYFENKYNIKKEDKDLQLLCSL